MLIKWKYSCWNWTFVLYREYLLKNDSMNIYSYNWQEKFYIHVYVCAHTCICSNKNRVHYRYSLNLRKCLIFWIAHNRIKSSLRCCSLSENIFTYVLNISQILKTLLIQQVLTSMLKILRICAQHCAQLVKKHRKLVSAYISQWLCDIWIF